MSGLGEQKLWNWFGLSYASFAILPRVMMHQMPDEWQDRMADLLEEWDDHWSTDEEPTLYAVCRKDGKLVKTPHWLINYRHPDFEKLESLRARTGER